MGVRGTTGSQGIQGVQGTSGNTGNQGIQGVQGTIGSQGIQGVQGRQGTSGTNGNNGNNGNQGIQGTSGTNGNNGNNGNQGIQGTIGLQGNQGTTGTGNQGTSGVNTALTSTYVGYGSASNTLTGSANLIFDGTNLTGGGYIGGTTAVATGRGLLTRAPAGDATPAILQFTNNALSAQWASLSATNGLLTSTGNMGISGTLAVTGSITVSSSNATGGGIVLADDGDIVDLNDGYASMRFSNGVRIFSANKGGSSAITLGSNGTISCGAVSMSGNLVINNSSPTIYFQDTDHRSCMLHNNSNLFYVLRGDGTNSTTWAAYNGLWPVTVNLENNDFTSGGNVTAYSDIRIKKNIVTIDNALAKTLKLRGIYYNRVVEEDDTKLRRVGVIAQEIQEVLPEVVISNIDPTSKQDTLSVDYGNITALLIEAIKEQQQIIVTQQKQIDQINATLALLVNK